MKMGLSAIMVGHVNFLLGALVHGVVLRHINQHRQARAMLYSISNVVALTSGMVVSSKHKHEKHWGCVTFKNKPVFLSGNSLHVFVLL